MFQQLLRGRKYTRFPLQVLVRLQFPTQIFTTYILSLIAYIWFLRAFRCNRAQPEPHQLSFPKNNQLLNGNAATCLQSQ